MRSHELWSQLPPVTHLSCVTYTDRRWEKNQVANVLTGSLFPRPDKYLQVINIYQIYQSCASELFTHSCTSLELCDRNKQREFMNNCNRSLISIKSWKFLDWLKIKSVQLQARRCPDDSRKLRFQYFLTTAQDGGKFVSLKHRSL